MGVRIWCMRATLCTDGLRRHIQLHGVLRGMNGILADNTYCRDHYESRLLGCIVHPKSLLARLYSILLSPLSPLSPVSPFLPRSISQKTRIPHPCQTFPPFHLSHIFPCSPLSHSHSLTLFSSNILHHFLSPFLTLSFPPSKLISQIPAAGNR